MTGASGLVGRALCATLREANAGIRVRRLLRRPDPTDPDALLWSAQDGIAQVSELDGVDAVVHLAGEPIGPTRWSASRKQRLHDSRVLGTRGLAETLAELRRPPKVLVQASAVGFYGNTGDEWVDEGSPIGEGFLAELCRDWESASQVAQDAGIRVLRLRLGHVLGRGGLLATLRRPTRLGLGGRLGSGRQFWSWIGLGDLVSIILLGLGEPRMAGVVNAVAPEPVRNADFARRHAAVLHRPAWLPAPAFALRVAFGAEQAREMLLWGQRVRPQALATLGFSYAQADLDAVFHEVEAGTSVLPVAAAAAVQVAGIA